MIDLNNFACKLIYLNNLYTGMQIHFDYFKTAIIDP